MQHLRTEARLKLSISPIYSYDTDQNTLKICFLNLRSLHRHIEDIRKDLNYSSVNVNIFSDKDTDYAITGYNLFRNDNQALRRYSSIQQKPFFVLGYPICKKHKWC